MIYACGGAGLSLIGRTRDRIVEGPSSIAETEGTEERRCGRVGTHAYGADLIFRVGKFERKAGIRL